MLAYWNIPSRVIPFPIPVLEMPPIPLKMLASVSAVGYWSPGVAGTVCRPPLLRCVLCTITRDAGLGSHSGLFLYMATSKKGCELKGYLLHESHFSIRNSAD